MNTAASKTPAPTPILWARQGSYPPRPGNEIQIFIDGQVAYREIAAAFHRAKQFIYLTISYGDPDFLLVPESKETFFDILRSRSQEGVDVRMVVWQPATLTADTIPDPAPAMIPGVNAGPRSIQARWDKAKGYMGWYSSPHGHFKSLFLYFPAELGCHHQKTYIMDDGEHGYVAFVGGINPVQSYWDTTYHDSLDARRLDKKKWSDPLKGLEETPPLHDIFFRLQGPAVGDVLANFVERFNGASLPHADVTSNVEAPVTPDQIPPVANGIEVQVLRTIAPGTYGTRLHRSLVLVRQLMLGALRKFIPETYRQTKYGDRSVRELYLKALQAAGAGSLVYIESQYFFDHGIVAELYEAAENRGAKIIILLTSKPDEGLLQGKVESILEKVIVNYRDIFRLMARHDNVALLTLGNCRPDPRTPGKFIADETYIHSKTMAVTSPDWALMTGGSANIAFTSMWFHSEMDIAFMDPPLIKNWLAQLWAEHLQISVDDAKERIENPGKALKSFKDQATQNQEALQQGLTPRGRVYPWRGADFPPRDLTGINLDGVYIGEKCR
jgi:phosphatidylserine/phosphatidylglycerophosphate/cardiolipin synthase-like enzyme